MRMSRSPTRRPSHDRPRRLVRANPTSCGGDTEELGEAKRRPLSRSSAWEECFGGTAMILAWCLRLATAACTVTASGEPCRVPIQGNEFYSPFRSTALVGRMQPARRLEIGPGRQGETPHQPANRCPAKPCEHTGNGVYSIRTRPLPGGYSGDLPGTFRVRFHFSSVNVRAYSQPIPFWEKMNHRPLSNRESPRRRSSARFLDLITIILGSLAVEYKRIIVLGPVRIARPNRLFC